jgi:pimeloyl-ACP methyl ester carboxylesterase
MSITKLQLEDHVVSVWGGEIQIHVKSAGSGPPVVYLHGAGGPDWDGFLDDLSATHTIYAVEHPGTGDNDPDSIQKVDALADLVLVYEEVVRALGLGERPACIGQSMGGMVAAELAATFPDLFARLILLAPAGLWREESAPREWFTSPPEEMATRLFLDPTSPAVGEFFALPEDPEAALDAQVRMIWAIGCTSKFAWPIPEKGLKNRLHRVAVPTLVIWGEDDDVMPSGYAPDWVGAIADCRAEVVAESGHLVQVEQRSRVLDLVTGFCRS